MTIPTSRHQDNRAELIYLQCSLISKGKGQGNWSLKLNHVPKPKSCTGTAGPQGVDLMFVMIKKIVSLHHNTIQLNITAMDENINEVYGVYRKECDLAMSRCNNLIVMTEMYCDIISFAPQYSPSEQDTGNKSVEYQYNYIMRYLKNAYKNFRVMNDEMQTLTGGYVSRPDSLVKYAKYLDTNVLGGYEKVSVEHGQSCRLTKCCVVYLKANLVRIFLSSIVDHIDCVFLTKVKSGTKFEAVIDDEEKLSDLSLQFKKCGETLMTAVSQKVGRKFNGSVHFSTYKQWKIILHSTKKPLNGADIVKEAMKSHSAQFFDDIDNKRVTETVEFPYSAMQLEREAEKTKQERLVLEDKTKVKFSDANAKLNAAKRAQEVLADNIANASGYLSAEDFILRGEKRKKHVGGESESEEEEEVVEKQNNLFDVLDDSTTATTVHSELHMMDLDSVSNCRSDSQRPKYLHTNEIDRSNGGDDDIYPSSVWQGRNKTKKGKPAPGSVGAKMVVVKHSAKPVKSRGTVDQRKNQSTPSKRTRESSGGEVPHKKRAALSHLDEETIESYFHLPAITTVSKVRTSEDSAIIEDIISEASSVKNSPLDDNLATFLRTHMMVDVFRAMTFESVIIQYCQDKRQEAGVKDADEFDLNWILIVGQVAKNLEADITAAQSKLESFMILNEKTIEDEKLMVLQSSENLLSEQDVAEYRTQVQIVLDAALTTVNANKKSFKILSNVALLKLRRLVSSVVNKICAIWAKINDCSHLFTALTPTEQHQLNATWYRNELTLFEEEHHGMVMSFRDNDNTCRQTSSTFVNSNSSFLNSGGGSIVFTDPVVNSSSQSVEEQSAVEEEQQSEILGKEDLMTTPIGNRGTASKPSEGLQVLSVQKIQETCKAAQPRGLNTLYSLIMKTEKSEKQRSQMKLLMEVMNVKPRQNKLPLTPQGILDLKASQDEAQRKKATKKATKKTAEETSSEGTTLSGHQPISNTSATNGGDDDSALVTTSILPTPISSHRLICKLAIQVISDVKALDSVMGFKCDLRGTKGQVKIDFLLFLLDHRGCPIEDVISDFEASDLFSQVTCQFLKKFRDSDYFNTAPDGFCVYRVFFHLLQRAKNDYRASLEDMKLSDGRLRDDQTTLTSFLESLEHLTAQIAERDYVELSYKRQQITRVDQARVLLESFGQALKFLPKSFQADSAWIGYASVNMTLFNYNIQEGRDEDNYAVMAVSSVLGMLHRNEMFASLPTFADVKHIIGEPPNYCIYKDSHAFVIENPTQEDVAARHRQLMRELFTGLIDSVDSMCSIWSGRVDEDLGSDDGENEKDGLDLEDILRAVVDDHKVLSLKQMNRLDQITSSRLSATSDMKTEPIVVTLDDNGDDNNNLQTMTPPEIEVSYNMNFSSSRELYVVAECSNAQRLCHNYQLDLLAVLCTKSIRT